MTPASKPAKKATADATGAISAAVEMTSAMTTLSQDIVSLQIRGNRYKKLLTGLALSVLFDVGLSVGLFVAVHNTDNTVAQLRKVNNAVRINCEATNVQNKKQRVLWNGLFATVQASSRALPQDVVDAVSKQLDETFVQRDCR